jgi:hypothetical protein
MDPVYTLPARPLLRDTIFALSSGRAPAAIAVTPERDHAARDLRYASAVMRGSSAITAR